MSIMGVWGLLYPTCPRTAHREQVGHSDAGCCPSHGGLCFIPSTKTGAGMMGQPGLRDVSGIGMGPSHICPALSTPGFCDSRWPWFWRENLFREGEGINPVWVISPKSILGDSGQPAQFLPGVQLAWHGRPLDLIFYFLEEAWLAAGHVACASHH